MVQHPAFNEEERALAATLELIESLIQFLKTGAQAGASREARGILQDKNEKEIYDLLEARPEPYFGRIQFTDPEDGLLDHYIGRKSIATLDGELRVMSWTSPAAATWYRTSYKPAQISLDLPKKQKNSGRRKVVVDVVGRRLIHVEDSALKSIEDSFWGNQQPISSSSDFFDDVLGGDKGDVYRDIVETITPDQYDLIANDKGGPRIIDGVPGSGKTTVAFHRLSYLVSADRQAGKRLSTDRVLALGPSPLFVLWSGTIRSSLQLDSVNYFTVEDWLWRWISNQGADISFTPGEEPDQEELGLRGRIKEHLSPMKERISDHIKKTKRTLFQSGRAGIKLDLFYLDSSAKGSRAQFSAAYDRFASGEFTTIEKLNDLRVDPPKEPVFGLDMSMAVAHAEKMNLFSKDSDRIRTNLTRVQGEIRNFAGRSRLNEVDAEIMRISVDDDETEAWIKAEEPLLQALMNGLHRLGGPSSSSQDELERAFPNITFTQVGQDASDHVSIHVTPAEIAALISDSLKEGIGFESSRRSFTNSLTARIRARATSAKASFKNYHPSYNEKIRSTAARYVDTCWAKLPLREFIEWYPARSRADATRPDRATLAAWCVALASQLTAGDPSRKELDHIIVDEAQDLSEMELRFLSMIARDSSVTLVGDIRQSTTLGIDRESWDEVQEIFSPAKLKIDRLDVSLRSTEEITDFANEILKLRGVKKKAKAYKRTGPAVNVREAEEQFPDRRAIAAWIAELGNATGTSAVILPPGASEQRKQEVVNMDASWGLLTGREYMKVLTSGAQSVETETHESQRRVLLSADEAKGLEFNHVLVLQADENAYPDTPQGGALLYIACTRAARKLNVVYWGKASKYLPVPKKKR